MLAFLLVGTFAFANNSIENNVTTDTAITDISSFDGYVLLSNITFASFDVCTITVSIYQDGELVASGTWTDNTGDCMKAARFARTLAFIELDLNNENYILTKNKKTHGTVNLWVFFHIVL